jgi:hypothetical protein
LIIRIKNHYFSNATLTGRRNDDAVCCTRSGNWALNIDICNVKYHEIRSDFGKDFTILTGSLQGSGLSWRWKFLSCPCECTRFLRLRSILFIYWEFVRSTDYSYWTLIPIIPHTYLFFVRKCNSKITIYVKTPKAFFWWAPTCKPN